MKCIMTNQKLMHLIKAYNYDYFRLHLLLNKNTLLKRLTT